MNRAFLNAFMALLLFSAFFISNTSALKLSSNEIIVSIDKEGYAAITENYYLNFDLAGDENKFRAKQQENQTSLSAWRADLEYEFIYPKFRTNENDLLNSNISWDGKSNDFILNYTLKKPLANLIESKPREDSWKIQENVFRNFISQGFFEVPENMKISFMLPANSVIEQEKLASIAAIENNSIEITGIRTNSIEINYSIPKPIAPESNTGLIEKILSDSTAISAIIIICILLIGAIYWKRKKIESIAENFVVNNSQMERKETDESEIEFE